MQRLRCLTRSLPLTALAVLGLTAAAGASCPSSYSATFSNGRTYTVTYVSGSYSHDDVTDTTSLCYDLTRSHAPYRLGKLVLGLCPHLQAALSRVRYSGDGGQTFSSVSFVLANPQANTGVSGAELGPDLEPGRYCFEFEGCWSFSEDEPSLPAEDCPVVGLDELLDLNKRGPIQGVICAECPAQPPMGMTCPTPADVCSTHKVNGVPGADVTWSEPNVSGGVPPITIECRVGQTVVQSGDFFPEGTTTVTCTATDANGDTQSCDFTVTVDRSTQLVLEAVGQYTDPVLVKATLTDLCGAPIVGASVDITVDINGQTHQETSTTDQNGCALLDSPPFVNQVAGTGFSVTATFPGDPPVEGQSELCRSTNESLAVVECEDALLDNLRCENGPKGPGGIPVQLTVDVSQLFDGTPGDLTAGNTAVRFTICDLNGARVTSASSPVTTAGDPSAGTATAGFTLPCGLYTVKIEVTGDCFCSEELMSGVDADPPLGVLQSRTGQGTAENTAYNGGAPYATRVATVKVYDNGLNPTLPGSGLCAIRVVRARNCLIFFDHPGGNFDGALGYGEGQTYIPPGAPACVVVSAIRIDPTRSASFLMEGVDCCGNRADVDPIYDTLTLNAGGYAAALYSGHRTGDPITMRDRYWSLTNTSDAPMQVRLSVNYRQPVVVELGPGRTALGELDYLKDRNSNRLRLEARGAPGTQLEFILSDVPAAGLF